MKSSYDVLSLLTSSSDKGEREVAWDNRSFCTPEGSESITHPLCYLSVSEVLAELVFKDHIGVYRLSFSYPRINFLRVDQG